MVGSFLSPKWPIQVPFWGMDHQKSNFLLILALFLSEAVEASWCHFFENWWMKLKCPLLLKPLATIVQENSQSFYLSEPFRIYHFTMRHPVVLHLACKVTCYFWLISSVLVSVLRTSINVLSKSKSRNYVTWIANVTKLFLSVYARHHNPLLIWNRSWLWTADFRPNFPCLCT